MANNQFLVSVANAIGRDANNGRGIFLGKANISSAFSISTSAQEVRGGVGNPLLYVFYHSRKVEIKIESATFDKSFISMNVGTSLASASVTTVQSECITLVNGVGTCTLVPTSDIVVFMTDGTIQNITPVGSTFTTSPSGGSTSVDVVYNTTTTSDQFTISTSTPPSVIDLTLIGEVRDNTGVIVNYLQINIPRFQISGNYSLSLNANGVSTQSIDGMALEVTATDCSGGNYFAKVTYVTPASSAVATSSIVAIPSTLLYPASASTTRTLTALAIKGTSNVTVTTSASFTTSACQWSAGLHTGIISTVSASGIIAGLTGSVVVAYYDSVSGCTWTDSVNLLGTA